ncbi:hypothetical protein KP509_05G033600 [Ceratopteris richardii]|uniref:Pentatricopeptide repeat-containing protein n=1 Tax=Ceratopteris richardii TaxID=49495 RepID=A0A8T2UPP5_CERRI|nr:hypothetical protein KP509_05G033600 [Ceratopteris richardii]
MMQDSIRWLSGECVVTTYSGVGLLSSGVRDPYSTRITEDEKESFRTTTCDLKDCIPDDEIPYPHDYLVPSCPQSIPSAAGSVHTQDICTELHACQRSSSDLVTPNSDLDRAYELAERLQHVHTYDGLVQVTSGCTLAISTDVVLLLFSRLKRRWLGYGLYIWMKSQPGFEMNDIVFSVLIQNFIRAQKWQAVEKLYEEVTQHGKSLDSITLYKVMRELNKAHRFDLVERWFERIPAGVEGEYSSVAYNELMLAYYKEKSYDKVNESFVKMKDKNVPQDLTSYCIALSALRDAGDLQRVLELHKSMQEQGVVLDRKAYSIVFDSMGKAGKVMEAAALFLQMQQQGLKPDNVAYNSLLHAFSRSKMYGQAESLFQDAIAQGIALDPVIFFTMIKMYADAKMPKQAHEVLLKLKDRRVKAPEYAYQTVINAYARANCFEEAEHVFNDMRSSGCKIREVTYASMIKVYAGLKNEIAAVKIFEEMVGNGYTRSVVAYCSMIDLYSKMGHIEKSVKVFDDMKRSGCHLNTWVYNIMIEMFGRLGRLDDALNCLEEMITKRVFPDTVTYSTLIKAAISLRYYDKGIQLYECLKSLGLELDTVFVAVMINACIKSKKYTVLESLVLDAQKAGVTMDHRMYMSILKAFSDAGLLEKVKWFKSVIQEPPDQILDCSDS